MLRILPEQLFDAKQLDCHAQHGYGQENIPCIDLGGRVRVDGVGNGSRDEHGTSQDGDDL
jgi:hypothetical protein